MNVKLGISNKLNQDAKSRMVMEVAIALLNTIT